MKSLLSPKQYLSAVVCAAAFFSACSKSDVQPQAAGSPFAQSTDAAISNLFSNDDEVTTRFTDSGNVLKYRPDPSHGQDVYSDYYAGTKSGNQNYVPELPVNVWEYGGLIITRSFISFPKLSLLPDTLNIVSAKLYLYPPKDFLNHPQGNTGANECVIQRITQHGWKEDGLTWENQPREVTEEDQAIIPATTDQFGYHPVVDVTALVKKIVKGQVPNYGFRIKLANEYPLAAVNFASSEATDSWRRPMLEIEYK